MKLFLTCLGYLLLVLFAVNFVVSCAGTRSAYQAAETLEDTAYVVTEHYAALVKEAADLRENGTLTGDALSRVQSVEMRSRPIILRLRDVSSAWTAAKTAANEAALSKAIGDAAAVVSDLINAIKGRQGNDARLELNLEGVPA